jgi:hypothetical protein
LKEDNCFKKFDGKSRRKETVGTSRKKVKKHEAILATGLRGL